MVRHYFPGLAPEEMTDEALWKRYVEAQWLEDRMMKLMKIAVNHGFAGEE